MSGTFSTNLLGFLCLFTYLETVVYAAETSLELELEILLSRVSQHLVLEACLSLWATCASLSLTP